MSTTRLPAKERKKQIILSAISVFARNGFHAATTREIAAEAGVAEALIYRYFDGKQALFSACMEITASRLVEILERIVATNKDEPAEAISSLLGVYVDLVRRNEDLAKMVFVISAELDNPSIREVYTPFQERSLEVVEQAVRDWRSRGLLKKGLPARAVAWVTLGTFHTIALMKHTGALDEFELAPAIQLVRATLLGESAADRSEES